MSVRTARIVVAVSVFALSAGCGTPSSGTSPTGGLPTGSARVAQLPHHDGLQYCIHLTPRMLAPAGSQHVLVHSFSVYLTSTDPNLPAVLAIKGRYPGWDTPGTTIYEQPFTNTNTVWVEIDHEFGTQPIDCIEVYGSKLIPSSYASFRNRLLLGYTYFHGSHGYREVKLFPIHRGAYLPQYSPRRRPPH